MAAAGGRRPVSGFNLEPAWFHCPIVSLIKAMVFPVVLYRCNSWTIMEAKSQRIDAFQLWCWGKLLRVSWTARSTQSILKEINPEY